MSFAVRISRLYHIHTSSINSVTFSNYTASLLLHVLTVLFTWSFDCYSLFNYIHDGISRIHPSHSFWLSARVWMGGLTKLFWFLVYMIYVHNKKPAHPHLGANGNNNAFHFGFRFIWPLNDVTDLVAPPSSKQLLCRLSCRFHVDYIYSFGLLLVNYSSCMSILDWITLLQITRDVCLIHSKCVHSNSNRSWITVSSLNHSECHEKSFTVVQSLFAVRDLDILFIQSISKVSCTWADIERTSEAIPKQFEVSHVKR